VARIGARDPDRVKPPSATFRPIARWVIMFVAARGSVVSGSVYDDSDEFF
jgi:hypothetical protein